jgi:hypothetical protein
MKKAYLIVLIYLFTNLCFGQQQPNEWTVVATYEIPGKAGGITFDGTWLYSGLYSSPDDDNRIFKIDPTDGSYELLCYAPIEDALGLTYDGTYFWSTDRQGSYDPALAVQFDMDGNFVSNFELPATYFAGIEYLDDGTFWATCYYDPDGEAFHLANDGSVIDQFATPNNQPWAICQMDGYFWIADYDADMLYLVDDQGNLIENHESIGIKPTGIVFDGTYLWYVTGPSQQASTLYKVDLGGGGNAVLDIQPQEIALGNSVVADEFNFELTFYNTGGSNGFFSNMGMTGTGTSLLTFENIPEEVEVEEGSSEIFTINVSFNAPGIFDLVQSFSSNDPMNDEIEIHFFGQITNDGIVLETNLSTLNYSDIRIFANTRRFVELINTGNESLSINEMSMNNPELSADPSVEFPLNINPLDTFNLGIWFHPENTGVFNDVLSIESNAINSLYEIDILANAMETNNSIGQLLWSFQINDGYDQSPKAMLNIDDINGDGVGEVLACIENNNIMCFNGNSHSTADVLWIREIYSGNIYQQNAIDLLDDIDADGISDFIVGTTGGDKSISCISSQTGAIIWKFYTNIVGQGGWVYQVYGQKDFNGDGINDALAAAGDDASDTGPKCVFLIDGSNGDEIWRSSFSGPAFSVIGVFDFTGDDLFDVVAGASNGDENQGKIYGIDGSNGIIKWEINTNGSSVWALEQLNDLNGDAVPDIVAGDFSGYYYFLDATNGSELASGGIGSNLILRFLSPGDINEDGFKDILIGSSSTTAYLIDGYTSDALWTNLLDDKAWNIAVANDLNMDGINEVIAGTLFQNNYSYFLDGISGAELSKKQANAAIDAISSIDDICRDWTMEMVVGDRDGLIRCYSGGLDGTVFIPENLMNKKQSNHLSITPIPNNGHFSIGLDWTDDEKVALQLIQSVSGKLFHLGDIPLIKGHQTLEINLNTRLNQNISSGLYTIQVIGKSSTKQAQFIYLKK